ncbi:MAG: hypothetical protein ACPG33_00850 [Flavobacteriaceae bacterium]
MLRILIPLCSFFVIVQQPVFDGVVSAKEWQDAQQFFIGSFNSFQLSPKLRIGQSLRYSQMRSKEDNSLYYKGYIARLITNYQFNKDLSFRLVSEYNEFDDTLFVQPLLKWNPNPFTVLFVGGSQGYGKGEIAGNLDIDSSQLYFKFQYLFEI